jgi:hypothetical protein
MIPANENGIVLDSYLGEDVRTALAAQAPSGVASSLA